MFVQHTSLALASLVVFCSLHSRPALEHNMSVRELPMLNCKARATAAAKITLQALICLSVYGFACVVIASCVFSRHSIAASSYHTSHLPRLLGIFQHSWTR